MSQLRVAENVPALERERETVSSPDDKSSNDRSVQAAVPIAPVDQESEPIVTRKELWSYYSMSLRGSPRSCEGIERLSSVLQWR